MSEAEGDELPPPPPVDEIEPASEDPVDPSSVVDTIDDAPDDISKVRLDMVESIRKALIINPNDVDQSLYSKLTNTTTLENLEDMETTVKELVKNYYPDTGL
tara:strand:+ start:528 stop:833 length:306 start_codon:yes stop_codon:yes gene_type:complete